MSRKKKLGTYYSRHREIILAKSKKWREDNPGRYQELQKRNRSTPAGRYRSYKNNAKLKGREFSLTEEEFLTITQATCRYCGTKPANGVDRIDNSKGYILNNSVACCSKCNMMKKTMNVEDFLAQITKIYRHQNDSIKHKPGVSPGNTL